MNEARVYLSLDGDDFNPDELTRFLGIKPTSIKRKGEKISGHVPGMNSWALSTENIVNDHIDVFEMARGLIDRLKSKKDLIIKAKEHFNVSPRLEVVLWFSMDEDVSTPAIGFEVDTIKFLGDIGAFVDIDTFKH